MLLPHETEFVQVSCESPTFIEGDEFGAAVQLDVLDEQECGLRSDGLEQHASQAEAAMRAVNDDVEDDGFVHEVGEDARECGQPAGCGITVSADQVGVFDGSAHVVEVPAAAPPFALAHAPHLLDLGAGEAIHELEFSGFQFSGQEMLQKPILRIPPR